LELKIAELFNGKLCKNHQKKLDMSLHQVYDICAQISAGDNPKSQSLEEL
jgi:hypothetical protein